MKLVKADSFTEMQMPGRLKAKGHRLAFLLRRPNLEENRYDNTLWLCEGEQLRPLPTGGPVGDFWWKGTGQLVFTLAGGPGAEPTTALFLLTLENEDAARAYLRLPCAVEDLAFLPNGGLIYLAQDATGELPLGAENRDEPDYEVVTEFPFWENGGGFTSARRRRLWLWQDDKPHRLTDDQFEVEEFRLCGDGQQVFFTARTVPSVPTAENGLYRLSPASGEIQPLPLPENPFCCHAFCPVEDGSLLLFGTDMRRHGLNQNGSFYLLDKKFQHYTPLYDGGGHTCWSSVNCDVQQGAGAQLYCCAGRGYFVSTLGGGAQLMSIGLADGRLQQERAAQRGITELACAGSWFYYTALHGLSGPELYRLDAAGETCLSHWNRAFGKKYALQKPEPLPSVEWDGAAGWMLRPAGWREGKTYPAILMIHGGPKTAWGDVFHHEMQYLASLGFAVLFCNPRGSDGRGDLFADIRGQYGEADCQDLLVFLDEALARHRWIDSARVGICGGSYGGFMVNWLIGHTSRFAVAVSQRGIANWGTMATLSDIGHIFVPDQAADPWLQPETAWRMSPLKYAGQTTTPTLFLHGDKDYRCPLTESLQMYTALKLRGVPTRLCIFKEESHEFARSGKPRHRVARLREIAGWLEQWLNM